MYYYPITLLCCFCSSAFALITYAITSLGDAISFQVIFNGFQLFGLMPEEKLSVIIAEYSIFGWPCALLQAFYIRKYIDLHLVLYFSICGAIGLVVGLRILMIYQSIWFKRCMGYLILLTYILTLIAPKIKACLLTFLHAQPMHDHDGETASGSKTNSENIPVDIDGEPLYRPKTCMQIFGALLAFTLAGIAHGMFGIGGPPVMLWIVMTDVNRNQVRGSSSCGAALVFHPITFGYLYLYEDQLNFTDNYTQYATIFVGGILGLGVGNIIAKRVDQRRFKQVIQFLLIIGAQMMGLYGFEYSTMIIPVLAAAILTFFCCYKCITHKKYGSYEEIV